MISGEAAAAGAGKASTIFNKSTGRISAVLGVSISLLDPSSKWTISKPPVVKTPQGQQKKESKK